MQVALDAFAEVLVSEYHMAPKPDSIPNDILTNVALLVCHAKTLHAIDSTLMMTL
jgi:hypothetical protein